MSPGSQALKRRPALTKHLAKRKIFKKDGLRDRLPILSSRKTKSSPSITLEPAKAEYGNHTSLSQEEQPSIRYYVCPGIQLKVQIRNHHMKMISSFV